MKPEILSCSIILPVIVSFVFAMDESKPAENDQTFENATSFPIGTNFTMEYGEDRIMASQSDSKDSGPVTSTDSLRSTTTYSQETTVKYSNTDKINEENVDLLSKKMTLENRRSFSVSGLENNSNHQNASHGGDPDGSGNPMEFNMTELTTVPISTTPNPVCEVEVCSRYPLRRFPQHSSNSLSLFHSVSYSSPTYVSDLLDLAPCPPPWNLSIMCRVSSIKLSCSDKTHILTKCLQSAPPTSHCGELLKCSKYLGCDEFGILLETFKHCSIKYLPQISTPPLVTVSGGYLVKTTNHSDVSARDVLQGETSILLIIVAVFGFLFVPFIVYLLLNRNYRRAAANCLRHFCCNTCKCCKHRQNSDYHVEENEPIAPIATIPMTAVKVTEESPTISRDSSSDSGIGLSMDYDFIDENIPLEYQMASRH